jgi:hypothetical protein
MLAAACLTGLGHAAGFSHKQHLALKIACPTCHTAAVASTKASDNLLPNAAVCRECHSDNRQPRSTPTPQFVAKFNHSLHLKMGNVAPAIAAAIDKGTYMSNPGDERAHLNSGNPCEACHRGLEDSDRITAANFPRMADCLVCHNKIDVPFSCAECHSESQLLRPASHTPNFLDTHSSGKLKMDKSTCAVCHGRRFTCQGCH